MVKKYRRKPIVIEAIQWTGDNTNEVLGFGKGKIKYRRFIDEELYVKTLEGELRASKGDYIIKGVRGEFYPCKPDIFEKIYEEVKEN